MNLLEDFEREVEGIPVVYALHPENRDSSFLCADRSAFLKIARTLQARAIIVESFKFDESFFDFDLADSDDPRFSEFDSDDGSIDENPGSVDLRDWRVLLKTYASHTDDVAWFNAALVSEGSMFLFTEPSEWYTAFLAARESALDAYAKHLSTLQLERERADRLQEAKIKKTIQAMHERLLKDVEFTSLVRKNRTLKILIAYAKAHVEGTETLDESELKHLVSDARSTLAAG